MTVTGKTASIMMIMGAGGSATVSGLSWLDSIGANAQAYGILITGFAVLTGVVIKIWQLRELRRHNLETEKNHENYENL